MLNTGNWYANNPVRKFLHRNDDEYAGAAARRGFIAPPTTTNFNIVLTRLGRLYPGEEEFVTLSDTMGPSSRTTSRGRRSSTWRATTRLLRNIAVPTISPTFSDRL